MRMQFGLTAFERARGDLPELPVVNMFAEKAGTEELGIVLQSRPGLSTTGVSLGNSSVQALFQKDGVFAQAQFGVADSQLWRDGSNLGGLDGPGPFFMDGYEDLLFVAGGGSLWGYDGTTLTGVEFPDSADVIKVVVGASRAILLREGTEQLYWSDPLSDTIDGLSFASAESQPDRLRDMLFIDDTLILFGAETVEFWPNTQDADLPFRPLEGRVYSRGVKATGAATAFGESFAWVTSDNRVCQADLDTVLSNEGLEEKIKASTTCRLWTFYIDATEFLALRLDERTYVMSSRSRTWSRFQSYGQENWIPQCFAADVFGSSVNGSLLEFGSDHLDLDGELERRFRAGIPLNAGGVHIDNLILRCNPGNTPYLTSDFKGEPEIEMRLSPNAGKTWGIPQWRALGEQGQYRTHVFWRACGLGSQPGVLAEFRVTAPVPFRVSDVLVNEKYGGR